MVSDHVNLFENSGSSIMINTPILRFICIVFKISLKMIKFQVLSSKYRKQVLLHMCNPSTKEAETGVSGQSTENQKHLLEFLAIMWTLLHFNFSLKT